MFVPIQSFPDTDPANDTDLPSIAPVDGGGVIPPSPSLKVRGSQQDTGFAPDQASMCRTPVVADFASRWNRFKARLTDSSLLMGAWFLMSLGDGKGLLGFLGGLTIIGILIYQVYLLSTAGQTIGKQVMHIKVVKADTGENGGFVPNVLLREIVNYLFGLVPLYSLVDILFIFRDDQRCVHDMLAGTRVVNE